MEIILLDSTFAFGIFKLFCLVAISYFKVCKKKKFKLYFKNKYVFNKFLLKTNTKNIKYFNYLINKWPKLTCIE